MEFWRLSSPDNFSEPALMAHHVHWICAVAFFVAIFASWVLLTVMQRYHESNAGFRYWWLMVGSVVMGTGIWAMHFTGMLAFSIPVKVEYSPLITLVSIVPAIIASGFFLALYRKNGLSQIRMLIIALIMAGGIGTMHYVGMEAMIVAADMYYKPGLFLLSIIAACILAYSAVYTYSRLISSHSLTALQARVVGSVTLGLAVSLMHFIAMNATFFQPNIDTVITHHGSAPLMLVLKVIVITLVLLLFASVSSIVDRRMSEISRQLQKSETRFQNLAESTQTAIFTFNNDHITYANPALCKITGHGVDELYSMTLEEIFDPEFHAQAQIIIDGAIHADKAFHREIQIHSAAGEKKWLYCSMTLEEVNNNTIGLASAFDITDQKNAEMAMRKLAYFDQLTQLHNRTVLMDRLQHCLDLMHRHDQAKTACVMILDLDGFKAINDSYGHLQGDKLLITVAERLKTLARSADTMSRFGGDEFVLLLEQIDSSFNIDSIAERILETLARPVTLDGRKVDVMTSIGIVELDKNYKTPDQVLHDADIALYRAKELERGSWVMFDHNLDAAVKRQRMLLPELKLAVEKIELQMYYQPICSAEDGSVCGFEALARWQRQNGEWVSPGEFIPLAEDAGLIHEIGLWALEAAASQLEKLNQRNANSQVYVSINIDAESLNDPRFYSAVVAAFDRHRLKPGQLKIELTERGLINDTEAVIPKMNALIQLGCEFMIDDFGTGYSSLSYLHQLPIKTLKIDRSFVCSLSENESSKAVVRTIIALSESLGLTVVAEGVETADHVKQLHNLNSHQLQGYYFARPMPENELGAFLDKQSCSLASVVEFSADKYQAAT